MEAAPSLLTLWLVLCQPDKSGKRVPQNILSARPAGKPVAHFLDYRLKWEGLVYCGCCHHWTGGPKLYKKAGWASHVEQASKHLPSMAPASAPSSGHWLPFAKDYNLYGELNPLLPRFGLLILVFLTAEYSWSRQWGLWGEINVYSYLCLCTA